MTLAGETEPGSVLGTVGYMSPEQVSGRGVDFHSDQFSLGAILYEMAAGRRAFAGTNNAETLAAIIRDEPRALVAVNPSVPAVFSWMVERCLAKDPDDRYDSTRVLTRDLRSLEAHLGAPQGSEELPEREVRTTDTSSSSSPSPT